MTADTRIERALPEILADLGEAPLPDYIDTILGRTAVTRQRPGWTFVERWLPMEAVTRRTAAPRLPWRAIAVAALLIVALAAGAIFFAGRSDRELPAPYGPAGNGLVAYAWGGSDIYVADPATREARPITTGPEMDRDPQFSRDGTRLAFLRSAFTDPAGTGHVMLANVDGSGLRQLTDRPLTDLSGWDWSGDGRSIVVTSRVGRRPAVTIFDIESGEQRTLDLDMAVESVSFRPPGGAELLFVGGTAEGQGIYVIGADASDLRRVVGPTDCLLQQPMWAPDGSRIAYSTCDAGTGQVVSHVVGSDGTMDVVLENPAGVVYQILPRWAPDGTAVLVGRGYWDGGPIVPPATEPDEYALAIIGVDGSVVDRESSPSNFSFGAGWGWSPDGSTITSSQDGSFMVVDIATNEESTYNGWFKASWQRVLAAS